MKASLGTARRAFRQLLLPLVALCIACNDALGPCETTTFGPLVAVRGVTNAITGAAIDSVFITDIVVDGWREHLPFLVEGPNSFGARVVGDSLLCKGTCAFGSYDGTWQMVLQRDGYQDLAVTFEARYQHNTVGECPGRKSGPTEVRFQMIPLSDK